MKISNHKKIIISLAVFCIFYNIYSCAAIQAPSGGLKDYTAEELDGELLDLHATYVALTGSSRPAAEAFGCENGQVQHGVEPCERAERIGPVAFHRRRRTRQLAGAMKSPYRLPVPSPESRRPST